MNLHVPHRNVLAFVADTQAPMFVETLWLKAFNNRKATKLLFQDILRLHPHAFFLLGDLVNLGYSDKQWKPIDGYMDYLRKKGISLHAIMGNHEVMGQPKKGEAKFQQRFPDHVRTGYIKIIDCVAVVLVNSNFKVLSDDEYSQQINWYEQTLAQLDSDPQIEFIITGCHHSPFTNSRIVKPSKDVQDTFVPIFLNSKKSQLFLSGHAHAFEHFQVKGKDFLVIGGGGGLMQRLRTGIGTLTDLAENYKPMFHYITVASAGDHLQVRSYHLKKDFSCFEEGMKLDIKRFMEHLRMV